MATIATPCTAGHTLAVRHDASGPFPTLLVSRSDGQELALHGRRDPVGDADRWLTSVLHGADPAVLVLIGVGLGYALDALERRRSRARVLAMEPFPDALVHFEARRDWSRWRQLRRLRLVTGPDYTGIERAWRLLNVKEVPPVLVAPVLATNVPDLVAGCRGAVNRARRPTPLDPHRADVKQSMLHPDVLTSLEHFAATTSGAIVEIGTYIGGATIAMARGIRDSGRDRHIVAIEPGGANPGHTDLPSADVLSDLRRNLCARGLDQYVTIHAGRSSETARAVVEATLAARHTAIGMLCIDADGEVQRDFNLFLPLCVPGCLLSVDDYVSADRCSKGPATVQAVDALVASGRARPLGVFGYGTWMGVYSHA